MPITPRGRLPVTRPRIAPSTPRVYPYIFPKNGVLDSFNRADENPLANGNWSGPIVSGISQLKLVSNQAMSADGAAGQGQSYWSSNLIASGDMEVFCDVPTRVAAGRTHVWARIQNPGNVATAAAYLVGISTTAAATLLRLTAGSTFTTLKTIQLGQTVADGDGIGLAVIGNHLYVWYRPGANGAWRLRWDQVENTISGPGYIGLNTDDTTARIDNFGGGQIPVAVAAGVLTIPVGQTSETDLAQSTTSAKRLLLAAPLELDTAQALTARKSLILGQPSETDLAQAPTHRKTKLLGQASETDTAQAIIRSGNSIAVGQASETDLAQPVSHRKTKTIAQATETDSAQPVRRVLVQASESDVAFGVARIKSRTLGQPLEADLAQAVRRVKTKTIAQATELELAQPLTALGGGPPPVSKGPFKMLIGMGL